MTLGKVCLAYSGGLDTSIILAWLIEQGYEVVCFCADVGQEEDFEKAKSKALSIGAVKCEIVDLRREFILEQCWTAIQCNADAIEETLTVGHCSERFAGRQALLDYAAEKNIPVSSTKSKPWYTSRSGLLDLRSTTNLNARSMDENLAHCSYEDQPEDFSLDFAKGLPSKLTYTDGGKERTVTDPVELFLKVNEIAKRNGVGRIDILENRFIGIKSRGCYETPGLTCLRSAHIDLEGLTLDREVRALRDQFVTVNYSRILYNGLYFSPEREFLHNSIIASQHDVNGRVRCRAYKGTFSVLGRSSAQKLYDMEESSMDSIGAFSPMDTSGFISIQAIRLKKYGSAKVEAGEKI
ncbi:MAG: hypothetical protein Q9163_001393 [Psora crenata]